MLKRLNDVCLRRIAVLIFEVFKLLKIKRNDFFAMRQHSYFGVTHCENSEVQVAAFSK